MLLIVVVRNLFHETETVHVGGEGILEGGVDLPQKGEDLVPQLVALHDVLRIGAVLPPGEVPRCGQGVDFRPGGVEERPAEGDVGKVRIRQETFFRHPAEAFDAASAEEVQEESFRVVAGVVGRQDGLIAVLPAQLSEPAITELPRGHLDADPFLFGKGFRIERLHVAGYPMLGGPFADERLVGVAVCSPQAEVAVRNGKRSAAAANLFCQDHGVPATADGDEYHGPRITSCWQSCR